MRIEIKNIEDLIAFIENAPTLSDISAIKLVKKTTHLLIPFYQTKDETIKQLKAHFERFGKLPPEDRPLFLCSKQKEFSIKDLGYFVC
jgi:hypothetical protein